MRDGHLEIKTAQENMQKKFDLFIYDSKVLMTGELKTKKEELEEQVTATMRTAGEEHATHLAIVTALIDTLEKKKEELEAKMKKVDDNDDKIKNAMKTQHDDNLERNETNDRHGDQLKEQEEQLKELDQKLEAWALEWPQGGAQAGDAGGNRSSDATRRPRVRLPEVPNWD